eukprot:gnl/MRDRNA2_/MRDRNA2_17149_c0_seq1.p1 gnl/MRDRNA2_/MRDRNA2_17149_c0~~gnl/MRDRNA2_/MRDRNA2_17149_c0_seq1.p1  ORF type:complete len:228 (+),score=47.90 gnl/MRDRNA2_/MRDRNA2_17149_c0_seq1:98-685(+)
MAGIPSELTDEASSLKLAKLIATENGRRQLALADPLNPNGKVPDVLVSKHAADGTRNGFNFQCNQNYRSLPSYKRQRIDHCVSLAVDLKRCHQTSVDAIEENECAGTEENVKLAEGCFAGVPPKWAYKSDGKKQSKAFLQLGWLDRICLRKQDNVVFKIEFNDNEVARFDWAFVGGSDHSPVESHIRLSLPHMAP